MRSRKKSQYEGQRVLVVGLGLHGGGVATVRWLARQGARVTVTDRKNRRELAASIGQLRGVPVTLHLGQHRPADFQRAQRIIVNPAVRPELPELMAARRRGVPIENEATIFVREFPGRLIGVTGTRGKTTTTHLLGAIVQRHHRTSFISGNVRETPMLSYLSRATKNDWAVLELSSYQLEQLPVPGRPMSVAVMTNLLVDHLDRHRTMVRYANTKANLFRGQSKAETAIGHWDDPWCRRVLGVSHGRKVWFSRTLPLRVDGVTSRGQWVVEQRHGRITRLFSRRDWRLLGDHNLDNLFAAVAAARALGIPARTIAEAVRQFTGVPHRQEIVRTYRGHAIINDTAATSPDGALAALDVFPTGVFILGGTDKALDLTALVRRLARRRWPIVLLPGTATERLVTALQRQPSSPPWVRVESMSSAVQAALRLARPKQQIILSPGAASFGLFLHEFDRGDQFRRIVKALR